MLSKMWQSDTPYPRTKPNVVIFTALSVLNKLQNPRQKDLSEVQTALVNFTAHTNLSLHWIKAHCGIQGNEQADRLASERGQLDEENMYTSYAHEKTTIKPSPRKWKQQDPGFNQTASTNWTDQSRSLCSGWELGTTDLMPTCSAGSRLVSLSCAHATQASWLQNMYYSTAN